jgi:hypothetical protein
LEEEFSGLQFTEKDERMIAEERYAPYYCCGEYIVIDFTYIGRGTRKGIGGYIKTTMRWGFATQSTREQRGIALNATRGYTRWNTGVPIATTEPCGPGIGVLFLFLFLFFPRSLKLITISVSSRSDQFRTTARRYQCTFETDYSIWIVCIHVTSALTSLFATECQSLHSFKAVPEIHFV